MSENNSRSVKSAPHTTVLKEYFALYLREVRGLTQSSINHYFDALNNISSRLKEKGLVARDIYEIGDIDTLEHMRLVIYNDPQFIDLNNRGGRMYSAGFNNYVRFAKGKGFLKEKDKILLLDIPIPMKSAISIDHNIWKRSGIMRVQALEYAGYKCEIDVNHESFIAQRTKKDYMEGHHAVPLRHQVNFENSLDVYANIICLCPVCHRRIHFGLNEDRLYMMNQIYEKRLRRLLNSGIKLSKGEFSEMIF